MGCFGYICPVCNTQIVGDCFKGGELCRLKHVRHGKVIGETVGHYNEYGGVMEDPDFRSSRSSKKKHANSHEEIFSSEFSQEDSFKASNNRKLDDGTVFDVSHFGYHCSGSASDFVKGTIIDTLLTKYEEHYSGIGNEEINTTISVLRPFFDKCDHAVNKLFEGDSDEYMEVSMTARKQLDSEEFIQAFESLRKFVIAELPIVYGASGIIAVHEKCYQSLGEEEKASLPFSLPDPDQSWGEVREEFV